MISKVVHFIRAVTFTALLACTVIFIPLGPMFLLLPLVLPWTPFFKKPIQYRAQSKILILWETFITGLLQYIAGIKIKITGDVINPKDNCIYLMNHRTRLDWFYFWIPLLKMRALTHSRIIMKAQLKHIPGLGWAMQMAQFIFLIRKWEKDKKILNKSLDYFNNIGAPTQLLIFPEGTNYEDITKASSDKFAKKNDLPIYDYVLHPRTTGFVYLVQHMRKSGKFDAVYDMSIGYPDTIPQFEQDIAFGKFPKEVHYHIKRYSSEDLPQDEGGLAQWCQTIWLKKEKQLEQFYEHKHFDGQPAKCRDATILSLAAFIFQLFIIAAWLCLMWCSQFFFWTNVACDIFAAILYVYGQVYHGGIEMWLIDIYNRFYGGQVKEE